MADIHPTSVIEPGAQIAEDVSIGPFCCVGADVSIGPRTRLMSHVVITGRTRIGDDNVLWPHSTFGGFPQDVGYKGDPTELLIGDNNIIRENVTMHVGSPKGGGVTRVGDNNYIMVGVHVAHDCQLGNHLVLANSIMMAGHVHIEDHVVMGGGAGVHHFTTIGQYAFVAGITRTLHDVPPYTIVEGNPSRPRQVNRLGLARNGFSDEQIRRLSDACWRLFRPHRNGSPRSMEQKVADLEATNPDDPHVQRLIRSVRNSMAGRHGRYLESFR